MFNSPLHTVVAHGVPQAAPRQARRPHACLNPWQPKRIGRPHLVGQARIVSRERAAAQTERMSADNLELRFGRSVEQQTSDLVAPLSDRAA